MKHFESEAFDQFPYERLEISIPRRGLLLQIADDLQAYNQKLDGGDVFRLEDLGLLSDEELKKVCPVIANGSQIYEEDKIVWGKAPNAVEPCRLYQSHSPAAIAMRFFNGERNLLQISWSLAKRSEMDGQQSFAYIRGLFLKLVLVGICLPG